VIPANERLRPSSSSGEAVATARSTSGMGGSGALPTANTNVPFVVCPSTVERTVHATV
jgi:hypothetical protein